MSRTTRKKKTGSKSVDRSCGNHGSCPYCANGRKYKKKRQEPDDDEYERAPVPWWMDEDSED